VLPFINVAEEAPRETHKPHVHAAGADNSSEGPRLGPRTRRSARGSPARRLLSTP
jgi:hypothetical protein